MLEQCTTQHLCSYLNTCRWRLLIIIKYRHVKVRKFTKFRDAITIIHVFAHTHTHTHTADQLFQYIANETNTAKTSSSYGLQPVVRKNGASKSADRSDMTDNSSKKEQ